MERLITKFLKELNQLGRQRIPDDVIPQKAKEHARILSVFGVSLKELEILGAESYEDLVNYCLLHVFEMEPQEKNRFLRDAGISIEHLTGAEKWANSQ